MLGMSLRNPLPKQQSILNNLYIYIMKIKKTQTEL